VLERQAEPVVLVGHSYGGTVISVAGTDPKVKALVYVAALQPDAGESTGQLVASMKAVSDDIKPTSDKFLFLDPAKFRADFAADLPTDVAEFMAISQAPVSVEAFSAKLSEVAWHDKPSYGIVAIQDKALNPDLERWMYKRSGAKVTEVQASHAVYMSQPAAVAKVIEDAARSVN
jgi:pimeloyl-ACP methyl ester carboxylesterase